MKILKWVHKRINGTTSLVSANLHPQKGQDLQLCKQEVEMKERSLVKLSVADKEEAVLGWGDGLLAIGTLGFHAPHEGFIVNPRFSFRNSNLLFDHCDCVSDDQEYLDATTNMEELLAGEDDEKPLVRNAFDHHEIEEVAENEIVVHAEPFKPENLFDLKEINNSGVKFDRTSTTLADLFKADPNNPVSSEKCSVKCDTVLKDAIKEDKQMGKGKKFPTSFSAKLVKKLISRHEVQPIKKLNNMMRSMIKRKIYPELHSQKSAKAMENQGMHSMDENHTNEGKGLLQSDGVLASI